MRCKKHFSDTSSDVGVCGSCLRERLLFAIHSQTQTHRHHLTPAAEDRRKQLPAPNIFPRSVSPYVSRRKSDATRDAEISDEIRQRFFRTPQVIPTFTKKKSKFHAISKLFRSRSTKPAQLTLDSSSNSVSDSAQIATKLKPLIGSRNRGMSPVATDGCSPNKRSPNLGRGSGRTGQGRVKWSPSRSHVASGIGVCLSPLLRPSPSHHWKGVGPGGSGEIRSTVNPYLSTARTGGFYNHH